MARNQRYMKGSENEVPANYMHVYLTIIHGKLEQRCPEGVKTRRVVGYEKFSFPFVIICYLNIY
jgi:hypothetical protein